MFLSALQGYVVFIIIAVVMLQYAFAVFCLLKLAYMDITKKQYILWNLFILLGIFVGGATFLVYYSKHPELRIPKDGIAPETVEVENSQEQNTEESAENADQPAENTENADNE